MRILRSLLEKNPDLAARNNVGHTAIDITNDEKVAQILKDHAARNEANTIDTCEYTPLTPKEELKLKGEETFEGALGCYKEQRLQVSHTILLVIQKTS